MEVTKRHYLGSELSFKYNVLHIELTGAISQVSLRRKKK